MKNIDIEFVNIQSHEHTRFQLKPGLNFILAEDNNVGKSTIFKVLMCAMQLPAVPSADINELIRGTCQSARATFSFDDTTYTMWLFREDGKATRAFFEMHYSDGTSQRSLGAPEELRDAFDIVTGADGKVVNFNDADSVQLIVQDTPMNDEVLSKVLIDLKVDNIKANMVKLGQQTQQDYRLVRSKYDDAVHTVGTMHYVASVDSFNEELPLLELACDVMDSLQEPCTALTTLPRYRDRSELKLLREALSIYEGISDLSLDIPHITEAMSPALFAHCNECLGVLQSLQEVVLHCETKVPAIKPVQLANAREAIELLGSLESASKSLVFSMKSGKAATRLQRESQRLLEEIKSRSTKVICPVKGEVYYSDEECVPCSDRPALRHGEEQSP